MGRTGARSHTIIKESCVIPMLSNMDEKCLLCFENNTARMTTFLLLWTRSTELNSAAIACH
eukprot:2575131-Pleurochrysis_carterae.AAC.3